MCVEVYESLFLLLQLLEVLSLYIHVCFVQQSLLFNFFLLQEFVGVIERSVVSNTLIEFDLSNLSTDMSLLFQSTLA